MSYFTDLGRKKKSKNSHETTKDYKQSQNNPLESEISWRYPNTLPQITLQNYNDRELGSGLKTESNVTEQRTWKYTDKALST